MHFEGLRTTIYRVSNMEAAREWYSQALDIKPYFNEPFYIGFNVAGYELGLQPEEGDTTPPKSESVLTYWGVSDVDAQYKRLLELGATAHEAPAEVGGEIKVATVKDPWGNILGIIYNPHFSLAGA